MSDQALNIQFVQEVEKYPCLYNYELTQYSRKDITDEAWNNVGKIMNMSGMIYFLFFLANKIYKVRHRKRLIN